MADTNQKIIEDDLSWATARLSTGVFPGSCVDDPALKVARGTSAELFTKKGAGYLGARKR